MNTYIIKNAYEAFKKTIFEVKREKNWNNAAYLQGLIYSFDTRMKELSEENELLRNKEGVWLSPKEIKLFNNKLDELKIVILDHKDKESL